MNAHYRLKDKLREQHPCRTKLADLQDCPRPCQAALVHGSTWSFLIRGCCSLSLSFRLYWAFILPWGRACEPESERPFQRFQLNTSSSCLVLAAALMPYALGSLGRGSPISVRPTKKRPTACRPPQKLQHA